MGRQKHYYNIQGLYTCIQVHNFSMHKPAACKMSTKTCFDINKKICTQIFQSCNDSQWIFLETCFLNKSCAQLSNLYITKKTAKWLLNGKNLRLINYQKQDDAKHLCQEFLQTLFNVCLPAKILNLKLSV